MSEDSQILKANNNNYFFDAQSTTPIDQEVLSVINEILCGNVKEQSNNTRAKDYFSWPTVDQIKEFRRNGGRLI